MILIVFEWLLYDTYIFVLRLLHRCKDGSVSEGWEISSWGSMSDYANSAGVAATHACCDCGHVDACDDGELQKIWVDADGVTCQEYSSLKWCVNGGIGGGWPYSASLSEKADWAV